MIEIFYEGYAFTIEKKDYCDEYFSTITLANDRKFHFWDADIVSKTWEECLFQSLQSCLCVTKDYGISPVNIGEVFLDYPVNDEKWEVDEIPF